MSELSLFPERVAIGQFTDANGRQVLIYQSVEFSRALSALFERVGGTVTVNFDDVERALAASVQAPTGPTSSDLDEIQLLAPEMLAGQVAALASQVADLQGQVQTVMSAAAELATLRQAIEDARLDAAASASNEIGMLRQLVDEARLDAAARASAEGAAARQLAEEAILLGFRDPFRVDWERPGAIGSLTRNTGAFTSVAANAGVTISGGLLRVLGGATFITATTALTNGAAAALGTLATAPVAGNPTKWIGIDDNGTVRYIPAW